MPINYRPAEYTAAASGGDAVSPFSGTNELGHAGLSANLQSQLVFPEDFGKAHTFSRLQMDAGLIPSSPLAPGPEAHTLAALPGMETHALGVTAPVGDPISPMIQLIMKLPGIGAISSFFEALTALFMPGPDLFSSLDFSTLAGHAQNAVASLGTTAGEHLPINLSLLPANAPIFSSLKLGLAQGMTGANPLLNGKLGAGFSASSVEGLSRNPLYVSGQFDLSKPQFESGFSGNGISSNKAFSHLSTAQDSSLTSGPSLSENLGTGKLAGTERLFSDRLTTHASNSLLSTSGTASSVGTSQTLPLSQSTHPSALNVSFNAFGQEVSALPAVGQLKDGLTSGPSMSQNVGFHLGSTGYSSLDGTANLGPSGAVSNHLGGRSLLASDSLPTYRPTIGGLEKSLDMSSQNSAAKISTASSSQTVSNNPTSASNSPATLPGLKAKALTLKEMGSLKHITNHNAATSPAGTHNNLKVESASTSTHNHQADSTTLKQTDNHGHSRTSYTAQHKTTHCPEPRQAASTQSHKSSLKQESAGKETQANIQANSKDSLTQSNLDVQNQISDQSIKTSSYTIQKGDTLWDIAKAHTGTGLNWKEIYKINHDILGKDPNLIHTGTTIKLPDISTDIASTSSEATKYVVAPGDNLWNIAKTHLGGGEHWGELYKLNANAIGSNPRFILPGQELTLPGNPANSLASSSFDPLSHTGIQPPSQAQMNNAAYVPSSAPSAVTTSPMTTNYSPIAPHLDPSGGNTGTSSFGSHFYPTGHQVLPASSLNPPSSIGPDGAQAAQLSHSTKVNSLETLAPSSLRPDLSFLNKKAGQIK